MLLQFLTKGNNMSVFYKTMVAAFEKRQKPTKFLSNFFKPVFLDGIVAEIQGRDVKSTYSIDTQLGTGGRRHDFSYHDVKEYTVPEYNDYTVITEEDVFKKQFGQTEYKAVSAVDVANLATKRQGIFSDMQVRSIEKQASDAFFNGKIVLSNGDEITFRKKASHNIAKANADRWTVTTVDPLADIESACQKCIDDGKISASEFNLILESKGLNALLNNPIFRANADLTKNIKRADISMPIEKTPGAMYHGQFSAGAYVVNLWSYNEKYEIPDGYDFANEGTSVQYIPQGRGVLIPSGVKYKLFYGEINNTDFKAPSIIGGKLNPVKAKQLPYSYEEVKGGSAVLIAGVKSRPMVYPENVDTFVTFSNLTA